MKREILLIFFNLGVNFGNVFRVLHIVLANCLLHHNMWIHSSSAPRAACSMNCLMSTLNQTDCLKYGFTVYKNKGWISAAFLLPESIMCTRQICKKCILYALHFYFLCFCGWYPYVLYTLFILCSLSECLKRLSILIYIGYKMI